MTKTILDVGNCQPDHTAIKRMLQSHFDVDVIQAHALPDVLAVLDRQPVDLVLINRKLDQDYSDGIEILKAIKADSRYASTPAMLVTNYEEVQQEAMQLGALRGFGKLSLASRETTAILSSILEA